MPKLQEKGMLTFDGTEERRQMRNYRCRGTTETGKMKKEAKEKLTEEEIL